MTAAVQSAGDAWLLMAHDVRCEVLRVPSVFQQGHHSLSDLVEGLAVGEPENPFQPSTPLSSWHLNKAR